MLDTSNMIKVDLFGGDVYAVYPDHCDTPNLFYSRSFITRAYAELQAKLAEEEAEKIKVGDWVIVCSKFTVSVEYLPGEIIKLGSGWSGYLPNAEKYLRKLTPEEVARLPKP